MMPKKKTKPFSYSPLFAANTVLRGSFESFFRFKPTFPRKNAAVNYTYSHQKLFADAALLSQTLDVAATNHEMYRHSKMRPSEFLKLQRTEKSHQDQIARLLARRSNKSKGMNFFIDGKNKKNSSDNITMDLEFKFGRKQEDPSRNIAILLPPGKEFCAALLACWMTKGCAVPLNVNATKPEIDHVLNETDTRIIVVPMNEQQNSSSSSSILSKFTTSNKSIIQFSLEGEEEVSLSQKHRAAIWNVLLEEKFDPIKSTQDCLAIATSGTTGAPKAAIHSSASLSHQVDVLRDQWKWTCKDSLLHTLPLHHVHGLINGVSCAVASGAHLEFCKFDPPRVEQRLLSGDVNLFFSVPAAYKKLVSQLSTNKSEDKRNKKELLRKNIRLFTSGSSAAPVPLIHDFKSLTNHNLLERAGSTELGMILSHPYQESGRIPGTVGQALKNVQVKTINEKDEKQEREESKEEDDNNNSKVLSLLVRSPSQFSRYYGQPEKTKESFQIDENGLRWFITGDSVTISKKKKNIHVVESEQEEQQEEQQEQEHYSISGRNSVDILKVSGFKVSALEIENALLNTSLIEECAVFASPASSSAAAAAGDVEDIVAVIVPTQEAKDLFPSPEKCLEEGIKNKMKETVSSYKLPRIFVWQPEGIARNAMGKVNKKALGSKAKFEEMKQESSKYLCW